MPLFHHLWQPLREYLSPSERLARLDTEMGINCGPYPVRSAGAPDLPFGASYGRWVEYFVADAIDRFEKEHGRAPRRITLTTDEYEALRRWIHSSRVYPVPGFSNLIENCRPHFSGLYPEVDDDAESIIPPDA